jgi:nitric oxide synthase oxygenase domain/subunit
VGVALASIEGQMNERSHALLELRDAIRHLDQKMDARFDLVDRRVARIDQRFEIFDRRIESLDDKVSRQFVWLVGAQLTTLVAIVGALLARS